MFVAVDVGGTKVSVVGYAATATGGLTTVSPKVRYVSREYAGLAAIISDFLEKSAGSAKIAAISIGVAGPVLNRQARVTNLPWVVEADELEERWQRPVYLLNDLEAHGHGIPLVEARGIVSLRQGRPLLGNRALIAAGTGLGECILFWDGGQHVPRPSEGSHADFGPRNHDEIELLSYLLERFEHVSWESVVSGLDGFRNLFDFLSDTQRITPPATLKERVTQIPMSQERRDRIDLGKIIISDATQNVAYAKTILEWFTRLYGAEAGNLALKALATDGVYVGGGIAAHILPWLQGGEFLRGFDAKGRFRSLMEQMPVHVVTDPDLALKGAAHYAQKQLQIP